MTSERLFSGFDLFLRFADGCRYYLEDKGVISAEDSKEIRLYLENRGIKPSKETIKRVYYIAYPGLERVRARLDRESIFERDVVREFYSRDHNKMKYEQGNLICMAYPARVRDVQALKGKGPGQEPPIRKRPLYDSPFGKTACHAVVELEPVTGMFKLGTDIPLKKGDWVIVHRMNIIERVDKAFADRLITRLRKLGLDKKRAFPRKAFKYLTGLKYSSIERHQKKTNKGLSGLATH